MSNTSRIQVIKRYQELRGKIFGRGRSYEEVRNAMISAWDRYLERKHKNEDLLRVDLEWLEFKFDEIEKAEREKMDNKTKLKEENINDPQE